MAVKRSRKTRKTTRKLEK